MKMRFSRALCNTQTSAKSNCCLFNLLSLQMKRQPRPCRQHSHLPTSRFLTSMAPSLARAAGPSAQTTWDGPSRFLVQHPVTRNANNGHEAESPSHALPWGARCEETWPAGFQRGRLQPPHTFPGGPLAKRPRASEGGQTSRPLPALTFPLPKGPFSWSPVLLQALGQSESSLVLPFAGRGLAQ